MSILLHQSCPRLAGNRRGKLNSPSLPLRFVSWKWRFNFGTQAAIHSIREKWPGMESRLH